MTPQAALLIDVETSGVDATADHLLEVGVVLWSVEHRTSIASASWICQAPSNEAEAINGIPAAILPLGRDAASVRETVRRWAEGTDVIIAHNGDFDRQWLPELARPWIDSAWDCSWPRPCSDRKLTSIALAHGLAVLEAHRALPDCQLLARLLERVHELGHDVGQLLARAMRPKVKVVADVSFEQRDLAKAHGFRWAPYPVKEWWRLMPEADLSSLPFRARVVR
jgi:DNA polymerase-3 subunit epsilon